jgi:hypothetical protein
VPSDGFILRAKLNFTHCENYAYFILLTAKMVRKLFPRVTACSLLSNLKLRSSAETKVRGSQPSWSVWRRGATPLGSWRGRRPAGGAGFLVRHSLTRGDKRANHVERGWRESIAKTKHRVLRRSSCCSGWKSSVLDPEPGHRSPTKSHNQTGRASRPSKRTKYDYPPVEHAADRGHHRRGACRPGLKVRPN